MDHPTTRMALFFARGVLLVVLLRNEALAAGPSRRYLGTFGLVSDLRAARDARGLLIGDFNGDGLDDIACWGGGQGIRFSYRDADSSGYHPGALAVGRPIAAAACGFIDHGPVTDLVLLLDHPPELQVYIGKRSERQVLVWRRVLSSADVRIVLADISGDRRTDIILYGKKQAGIQVLAGRGDGTFGSPETLFPEYSFSTLFVGNILGDDPADVVATNWVSNQLLLFTGFGKMKFSDPSVTQFGSEPALVVPAAVDTDGNTDLAVAFPDQKTVRILAGDGLGGFRESQSIRLDDTPSGLSAGDINGDGRTDLAILSGEGRSLTVGLNNRGQIGELIPFTAGQSPVQLCLFAGYSSGARSAAILDTSAGLVHILENAVSVAGIRPDARYAAGLQPDGIVAADINRDGWDDIIVTNTGSRNLSVFLNEGDGVLDGQVSFALPSVISSPRYVPVNDSTGDVLVLSPEDNAFSAIGINSRTFSHSLLTVPLQRPCEILGGRFDSAANSLTVEALERSGDRAGLSYLTTYEQIAPARFIERPAALWKDGMAVIDAVIPSRSSRSVVSLVFDQASGRVVLMRSPWGNVSPIPGSMSWYAFDSLTGAVPGKLWSADLDGDRVPELIVHIGPPQNALYLCQGVNDTLLGPPRRWLDSPVSISSRDNLRIADMNGDGYADLLISDDLTKTLRVYLNRANSLLLPEEPLMSTKDLGGFVLDDINNDGSPELIVTNRADGTVRILSLEGR